MRFNNIHFTATAALGFFLIGVPVSAQIASVAKLDESAPAADKAIRPFRIQVQESELVDLRQRVRATRWPGRETVTDQSQGVQLAKIQQLVCYWGTDYNWRTVEAKLNAFAAVRDYDRRN